MKFECKIRISKGETRLTEFEWSTFKDNTSARKFIRTSFQGATKKKSINFITYLMGWELKRKTW